MKYIFHVKPSVTANSDGSTLIWLPESRSALRLEARSRSALKPMRIHNTGFISRIAIDLNGTNNVVMSDSGGYCRVHN